MRIAILLLIVQLSSGTCLAAKLKVVASIYPVGDIVRQVGKDYVDVTVVLPAGASPHTFEPTPGLIKKISSAKIFFMVGAGLEYWAEKFIKLAGTNPETVIFSQGIDLITTTDHKDQHHHHSSKVKNPKNKLSMANPHIWLDPKIIKRIVPEIISALGRVDPIHKRFYQMQGTAYMEKLDKLDRLISKTVSGFKIKKFISFHPSWDYFAKSYGLESVGVIEASPGKNPTPRKIINIVNKIKKYHIGAVFAEPQLNPRAAEVIAKEAKVKILFLDPLGGPGLKGRSTYIELMKYNLKILADAMK